MRRQLRSQARGPSHEPCENAAVGSASAIPARMTAQPPQPTAPSRSPASEKPKIPVKTGSSVKISAVCVALVRRWAQLWTRYASALANTPVTTSAPHTVQPVGARSNCPAAAATVAKPTSAATISTNVSASGS